MAATTVVTNLPGVNPWGTAVNQNTNRIYVSDANGVVRVIDGSSNTEIAAIAIPIACRGIAVNPTTNKIYVAGYLNGPGDRVHVIDGVTNTALPDVVLPANSGPVWIAVNPGLNRIYVGNETAFTVSVIDGASDTVMTTTAPLVGPPAGVGVHTVSGDVYVATANSTGPFPPQGPPAGGANSVTVLNSAGATITTIGPAGIANPRELVVDSQAGRAYVANFGSGTLAVIDTATNTLMSPISAGVSPFGIAVNRARSRAYVTGGVTGSVLTVVNLVTRGTEEVVQLALDLRDPEYNPVNDLIYAPEFTNTLIRVLRDEGEVCSGGSESWWNSAWRRRRTIDIQNGDVGEDFTDFPLLVKLDSSRIDYTKTKPFGDDLRFVAVDDATVLSYEIEKWDPLGTSFVWVRVPTITMISITQIRMYFDNPAALAVSNGPAVWDPSGFSMVQHLEETGGPHDDSTSNGNNATVINVATQGTNIGQMDGADSFAGGTHSVLVNNSATLNATALESLTVEAWIRTGVATDQMVVTKETPGVGEYQLWLSGGAASFRVNDGTDSASADAVAPLLDDNQFHYLVGRFDRGGSTAEIFVDGVSVGSVSNPAVGAIGSGQGLLIGEEADALPGEGGINFNGTIDEVRVSKVSRSNLWIEAQRRSMRDAYLVYGAEDGICNLRSIGTRVYGTGEALTADGAGTMVNVTIGSRTVFGAVTAWRTANRGRGDSITFGAYTGTVQSVESDTELTLTNPSTVGGSQSYTISRKFATLVAWEDCIDGGACGPDPMVSASLITDNRGEIGIAYEDAVLAGPLVIDGTVVNNTDAIHTITLTADNVNRHYGFPGRGAVVDNGLNNTPAIRVRDDYVTVEWMEIQNGSGAASWGIEVEDNFISTLAGGGSRILLRNNLIHTPTFAIVLGDEDQVTDVYNNITFGGQVGVRFFDLATWGRIRAFNNTFYNYSISAFDAGSAVGANRITLRNNIAAATSLLNDYALQGNPDPSSSNNMSALHLCCYAFNPSPAGGHLYAQSLDGQIRFVDRLAVNPNLHIVPASTATNTGANLSGFFGRDIDNIARLGAWDIGADDTSSTTAVTLLSFTGTGRDGAVDLAWTTASELQNLGFHLYRAPAASGPWTRITSAIIPGLGSSPTGRSYTWRDVGVANGTTYHYLLEDVETTGRTERHGPVSATPAAGAPGADDEDGGGEDTPPGADPGTAYGDPGSTSLRVLERTERGVVLELRTGGFYAVPEGDGTVRIEVPGYEESPETGLPVKRGVVAAVAGKQVRLVSVESSEESTYASLLPAPPHAAELAAGEAGDLQIAKGRRLEPRAAAWARLAGTVFQGEIKKAEVVFAPLRRQDGQLVLSGRIVARLEFSGAAKGELSRGGARGRSLPERSQRPRAGVAAQVVVAEPGLYRIAYEDLFPSGETLRRPEIAASEVRLSRQGQSIAYHLEPAGRVFGPGSSLFFVSAGAALNPEGEVAYELELHASPLRMRVVDTVLGGPVLQEYEAQARWEENTYYQAGLLDAEDLWQWDLVISPSVMVRPFSLDEVRTASSSPARIRIELQGASDFEADPDHHLRFRVNGFAVGETSFDGKVPRTVEFAFPAGALREGANQLEIENVADTEAEHSMVFLNRISLRYPRRLLAVAGRIEGGFEVAGRAEVGGIASSTAAVLDTTGKIPTWVRGSVVTPEGLVFGAEAGHEYLVTASARRATVRLVRPTRLRSAANRADYLVIGPQAFLDAAEPLLALREGQGLVTKAVSTEEVFQEFGHGETRAQAVKTFLGHAYHHWQAPSVRYVLLLGDATYDPKDYLGTGARNLVPALITRTSHLWTASDPAYAAVNGADSTPDMALGRLSAASVHEVQRLVQKILAFESGGDLLSGRAVFVSDNSDNAGRFEEDSNDLATLLASRETRKIYYSQVGAGARDAIVDAFDEGAGLLSYVGHGGTAVWASENIFNVGDVPSLSAQPRQPFLLTMNCLNGFFHFPPMDSLAEALVKAEGKGAVAAFSPSGLSENSPAHELERAILVEIESGQHERLGDAVLAAQAAYFDSGALPELLSIYNLLGDPALRIR